MSLTKDDVYNIMEAWEPGFKKSIGDSKILFEMIQEHKKNVYGGKWTRNTTLEMKEMIKRVYPCWHTSTVELAVKFTRLDLYDDDEYIHIAGWYEVIQKWCMKNEYQYQ